MSAVDDFHPALSHPVSVKIITQAMLSVMAQLIPSAMSSASCRRDDQDKKMTAWIKMRELASR